jgi:hypothetical protein
VVQARGPYGPEGYASLQVIWPEPLSGQHDLAAFEPFDVWRAAVLDVAIQNTYRADRVSIVDAMRQSRLAVGVHRLIADPAASKSLAARARSRSFSRLLVEFPGLSDMRVLDLGGYVRNWEASPRPDHLTVVNTDTTAVSEVEWATVHHGDACDLPAKLRRGGFDLVYSNSLIEHVGGVERRRALAEQVHEAADHHWVQTPYRYFPVEPHWLFPGFQFLPLAARVEVARRWSMAHEFDIRVTMSREQVVEEVLSVELLGRAELRHYFPTSRLLAESFLGLPKSLIAIR